MLIFRTILPPRALLMILVYFLCSSSQRRMKNSRIICHEFDLSLFAIAAEQFPSAFRRKFSPLFVCCKFSSRLIAFRRGRGRLQNGRLPFNLNLRLTVNIFQEQKLLNEH